MARQTKFSSSPPSWGLPDPVWLEHHQHGYCSEKGRLHNLRSLLLGQPQRQFVNEASVLLGRRGKVGRHLFVSEMRQQAASSKKQAARSTQHAAEFLLFQGKTVSITARNGLLSVLCDGAGATSHRVSPEPYRHFQSLLPFVLGGRPTMRHVQQKLNFQHECRGEGDANNESHHICAGN
jgi:hypothetical protein